MKLVKLEIKDRGERKGGRRQREREDRKRQRALWFSVPVDSVSNAL